MEIEALLGDFVNGVQERGKKGYFDQIKGELSGVKGIRDI